MSFKMKKMVLISMELMILRKCPTGSIYTFKHSINSPDSLMLSDAAMSSVRSIRKS